MKKNHKCTISPEEMKILYPNVFEAWLKVKQVLDSGRNVILCAPPKSGKRILVQMSAAMSMKSCGGKMEQGSTHVFVTSLNKRDIRPQIEEMGLYGINSFMLRRMQDVQELSQFVDDTVKQGGPVYVHFDESDYGTNIKQLFDKFFSGRASNPNIKIVCYSATNFEAAYSNSNERFMRGGKFAEVGMDAGEGYRGAAWFLDEGLVHQSDEFFDITPSGVKATPQGKQCLKELFKKDGKLGKVGVVRLCSQETFSSIKSRWDEIRGCIYGFGKNVEAVIVDQKSPYAWGSEGSWKVEIENGRNVLIFVHQTCTRSTELGFHERLAFWHEHREPESSTLSTIAQSVLRVAHYHPKGHRINVYTDKNAIEAYDGRTTPTMPLSCRMSNKRRSSGYKREFYSENDLIMVDGKGLKTTDPNKAKTVRIRGRTVPKPYNSPGSKDFTFTRYSRQGSRGGKRNLVDPVISGVPRSMKNPMVCFDKMGPDIAKLAGFTTVSGNDVLKEISSGKTVFYFARPTGKTQQPKTKQNSIFSRNPTATAI